MQGGSALWSQPNIAGMIEFLERGYLDGARAPLEGFYWNLVKSQLIRVEELARFWEVVEDCQFERYMEDLICGLHGLGQPIIFLLLSMGNEVAVYLGLRDIPSASERDVSLLSDSLRGAYPGIKLSKQVDPTQLCRELDQRGFFGHAGMLTGIPTLKVGESKGSTQQVERLLRGLSGKPWGYLVVAQPLGEKRVAEFSHNVLEALRIYSSFAKGTIPKGSGATAEVFGGTAQYCVQHLQRTLDRLTAARLLGWWRMSSFFFSPAGSTLWHVASLLRAIYGGDESTPDPVRTFICYDNAQKVDDMFTTELTSRELAVLTQLPREEMPGYAVKHYARFKVSSRLIPPKEPVRVGVVIDGHTATGNNYEIERSDLAKHGLVAGVTGSGKTNSLFCILDQVWQRGRGIPFLVVEPAKTEYRDLMAAKDNHGQVCFPQLRVFTMGDEQIAPLRLNPFEFEVADDKHRVHVQTHIDLLKSVFNASFVMYAPMPYVLERCLHEVYQERGWDLVTGLNRRAAKHSDLPLGAFPTLTDLHEKVAEVVGHLGYEQRIRMDVQAALQTRINSLRIGGKGLMLDVRQSLAMADLLTYPTVLELEAIGDDEEKAFIIGLILTRLYEHRVVQAKQLKAQGLKPPLLQHITVVEEAHRLLKKVPTDTSTEVANVKGKAVETFANMLSEVRAYGEGILVAEQIPTKLTPDVIKNTNLKIVHRIVAADDRLVLGETMNLDDSQRRFISTLDTGYAVAYAEGADGATLIRVLEHPATKSKGTVTDETVQNEMGGPCTSPLYDPFPGCTTFCQAKRANGGRCDSRIKWVGALAVTTSELQAAMARYLLSLLEEADYLVRGYPKLRAVVWRLANPRSQDEVNVMLCVLVHGVSHFFERKARQYDWLLNVVADLRDGVLEVMADTVLLFRDDEKTWQTLIAKHAATLNRCHRGYKQQCGRAPAPYIGCEFCGAKCFYRYEVLAIMEDAISRKELVDIMRDTEQAEEMWLKAARVCLSVARKLIDTADESPLSRAAVCYAVQMGAALQFSEAAQRKLARGVALKVGLPNSIGPPGE